MQEFRAFLRDDDGSQTIAFVLWIPLFMFLLVIVIDASTLYLNQTEMWNVARDTARRMSAGQLVSALDAESFAAGQLSLDDSPYEVRASYDSETSMEVVITVQIADAMIFGTFLGPVLGKAIEARVVMRAEPPIEIGEGSG